MKSVPGQIPPSELFPELYAHIARSGCFPNMKAIADSVPRSDPATILENYAAETFRSDDDLRRFVDRWFEPPPPPTAPTKLDRPTMLEWIEALWPHLTRITPSPAPFSSLLALTNPYVVPGGMFRECYYWDSYFTMIGFGDDQPELREACVANLAEQIDRFGFVPNGSRTYYLSRSQPPTFYASVATLDADHPANAWARYLPQLLGEHSYWMRGEDDLQPSGANKSVAAFPDGAILNRYWDDVPLPRDEAAHGRDVSIAAAAPDRLPADVYRDIRAGCASGWDFSSRWFADRKTMPSIRTTSIVPVDLNALLYGLEKAIEAACNLVGDDALARTFGLRAGARHQAMNRWLWNDRLGIFDDFDLQHHSLRDGLTPASLFPLFSGLASEEQAARTGMRIAEDLLVPGGLLTTQIHTGEQWDAPNGWAPLHWIGVIGLARYGQDALAAEIAHRWVATVARVYGETGRIMEKYDVMQVRPGGGGEYTLQDGFGWTNGVTVALIRLYPQLLRFGHTRPSFSQDLRS